MTQSALRILEALLFVSSEAVCEEQIKACLPPDSDIEALMAALTSHYASRGVNLRKIDKGWAFRTAPDIAPYLKMAREIRRHLSRAALETLAIIAYHQPVTRPEIEEIRGKTVSGGTIEILSGTGWIAPKGRRRSPGRPTTWGTTPAFLDHFYLQSTRDLPELAELKAAGFLDARPASELYDKLPGMQPPDFEPREDIGPERHTPPVNAGAGSDLSHHGYGERKETRKPDGDADKESMLMDDDPP